MGLADLHRVAHLGDTENSGVYLLRLHLRGKICGKTFSKVNPFVMAGITAATLLPMFLSVTQLLDTFVRWCLVPFAVVQYVLPLFMPLLVRAANKNIRSQRSNMASLKRIALFILIAAAVIILSVNYKGNDVLKRGIVLGLGVDGSADGVRVTAEMISPGNGGEQVGTFTKTVSANGATVAEALQAIAEKAARKPPWDSAWCWCWERNLSKTISLP